VYISEDME